MTIEQFEQKQKEISDLELSELCTSELNNLCRTKGDSLKMSIPPRVKDTDMLFCELIRRFNLNRL